MPNPIRSGRIPVPVILKQFVYVASLLSLLAMTVPSVPAFGALVKIGGSGSALGTMRIMAEEYMKENGGTNVIVFPSLGSGGGIKAVLDGGIDIGLSVRHLDNEERARGGVEIEYGKTPFVLAVSPDNVVTGLTTKEIVDIYSGKLQIWPNGVFIRLIMRSEREKDTDMLKSISPEMKSAVESALSRKGMIYATTDQEAADKVAEISGVLSTSTLALIISEKRQIRPLAINGVKPSPEAISDESYPLFITSRFITRKEASPSTRKFIDFVYSDKGRSILLKNGYAVVERR